MLNIQLIYNFGIYIGLAFQLRDDLLDAYGDVATFGKQTGTDIKDNKKTFLFLRALEKADNTQQTRLRELFRSTPDDPTAKINEVIQIYNSLDICADVENQISILHNQAAQALNTINRTEQDKATLKEIMATLLHRKV